MPKEKVNSKNAKTTEKICPKCGKPLVLRTAKKGENAGNQFWGCSGFPKCWYRE
jgi:ssDNA-binding Zn-finger/Zn-ribbon topoisomerase 1